MATLARSAKSGNNWTFNDLESYHVSLTRVDALSFFGLQELPQPSVDEELLINVDAGPMHEDHHAQLITLLNLAMIPDNAETAVYDFVVQLFRTLGYARRERVACTRVDLPLFICGEMRNKDKRLELREPINAQAQLVAEAVAAFNENNIHRDTVGLPPLVEKVMPGMVMVGTSPIFFKIPVTGALSAHIRHGTFPPEETRVIYCYPPVPRPDHCRSEGMKHLDNRREILRCYEAFKSVVGIQ